MRGGEDAAVADAAEGWDALNDGLVAGIHHALNNRLGTLKAVGQVVEADLAPHHPLSGALAVELERLEAAVELLRLLAREKAGPEALLLEPVVADARRLFEMHHSLREMTLTASLQPGVGPLWIDPADLLRSLLTLTAAAAAATGERAAIGIEATGDAAEVVIVIRAGGDGDGSAEDLARVGTTEAKRLLERAGGSLETEADPAGFAATIRLPTLMEVRRREREGSGG